MSDSDHQHQECTVGTTTELSRCQAGWGQQRAWSDLLLKLKAPGRFQQSGDDGGLNVGGLRCACGCVLEMLRCGGWLSR
jgi:hypothetical protein